MISTSEFPWELYAEIHSGNEGDLRYYLNDCPQGCEVLELGCGEGRVSGYLTSRGLSIFGLDLRKDALEEAQLRGVKVKIGDMAELSFDRSFDRVIAPYNTLLCLADKWKLARCLRGVHRHLHVGGEFIFDVYSPDRNSLAGANGDYAIVKSIQYDGDIWDIFERSRERDSGKSILVQYRAVARTTRSTFTISIAHLVIYASEWWTILSEEGFEIISMEGDFTGDPVREDGGTLVVRVKKLDQHF